MEEEIPLFQTKYDDPSIENIYSIGDIHGDMMALIICLRDCAKVIKKREGMLFDSNTFDPDLHNLMIKPVSDPTYKDDLNYEWCGKKSYVVFLGDYLDRFRHRSDYWNTPKGDNVDLDPVAMTPNYKTCGEYIHEEIKILRFINALNVQAMAAGGKIIKLIGNHEMMNIKDYQGYVGLRSAKSYITPYALSNKILDGGVLYERREYFKKGNPGCLLLQKHGIGATVIINNILFVHGGVIPDNLPRGPNKINGFIDLNQRLNHYLKNDHFVTVPELFPSDTTERGYESSILWVRSIAGTSKIDKVYTEHKIDEYCENLYATFEKICGSLEGEAKSNCNSTMKLVVGHNKQDDSSVFGDISSSFGRSIENNDVYQVLVPPTSNAVTMKEPDNEHKLGLIYGITVGCKRGDSIDDPAIYRVDVGMSRGFESRLFVHIIQGEEAEQSIEQQRNRLIKYLYSKAPQILHFNKNTVTNKMDSRIIRTSLRNMIIHQPRSWIKDVLNDRIMDRTIQISYIPPPPPLPSPILPPVPPVVAAPAVPDHVQSGGYLRLKY
jgi:hypothetical protein